MFLSLYFKSVVPEMLKDDVGVLSSYSEIKVELFWETIYFPKVITAVLFVSAFSNYRHSGVNVQ